MGILQGLGESKIASMVESKDFRKGIIQLEWHHKKNLMKIEDLKNKMRIINMMKVTRQIQSVSNSCHLLYYMLAECSLKHSLLERLMIPFK